MTKEITIKDPNLRYDNVDDKKEIYNMLENYLDERQRESLLKWACLEVNTEFHKVLRPGKKSTWHPKEVYWQVMSLAFMHGLSLEKVANKITEIAKLK